MEEILHHLGCIKPYEYWDIYYINRCRISSINGISPNRNRERHPPNHSGKKVCPMIEKEGFKMFSFRHLNQHSTVINPTMLFPTETCVRTLVYPMLVQGCSGFLIETFPRKILGSSIQAWTDWVFSNLESWGAKRPCETYLKLLCM